MPPQNYKQNPDPKFDEEVKHRRVDKFPNKKPVIVESPYTTYHEMCPNIDACTHKCGKT